MSEFRFRIDAFTLETLPMKRLAEYLADLAALLGAPEAVHFIRLDSGSVIPVFAVEAKALPFVRDRLRSINEGSAPREARKAYEAINERLVVDQGAGALVDVDDAGAEIIRFPGCEAPQASSGALRKQGTLDGEVIRVGGANETKVPILLRVEGQLISGVHASKSLAQAIGTLLFKPVRLYGEGRWRRDRLGVWDLVDFSVDRFEPLQADTLTAVLTTLRAIGGGEWTAGSAEELQNIRHGEDE